MVIKLSPIMMGFHQNRPVPLKIKFKTTVIATNSEFIVFGIKCGIKMCIIYPLKVYTNNIIIRRADLKL